MLTNRAAGLCRAFKYLKTDYESKLTLVSLKAPPLSVRREGVYPVGQRFACSRRGRAMSGFLPPPGGEIELFYQVLKGSCFQFAAVPIPHLHTQTISDPPNHHAVIH
jgi:hypothetical protein